MHVSRPNLLRILAVLAGTLLCLPGRGDEGGEEEPAPLRVILVTGGCVHDYENQAQVLRAGISERVERPIDWAVRRQGDGRSDLRIPVFEDEDWAEGYDLVVHNYCFPRVRDGAYVDRILAPHREGLPAVLLHGTMHSFRLGDDRWFEFCGVTSRGHGSAHPFAVQPVRPEHPILEGIGSWTTPRGELYFVEDREPSTEVLAEAVSDDTGKRHPTVWTHRYGTKRARIFGATIGNDTVTMMSPSFLDTVTRGFLWAVDELDEESFRPVDPANSLSELDLDLPEAGRPASGRPAPGRNLLTGGEASALPAESEEGRDPSGAIDGDPDSFWRAASPGPVSWQVAMEAPRPVGAVSVSWYGDPPEHWSIEGSVDQRSWERLARAEPGEDPPVDVHVATETKPHRFLRITAPGENREAIGIREVAAYPGLAEAPAGLLRVAEHSSDLLTAGAGEASRSIRLGKGVRLAALGAIPDGYSPIRLVPAASGDALLLAARADERAVVRLSIDGSGGIASSVVLAGLPSQAEIAWDGEWIYVLAEGRITVYRDTDRDGAVDERHRLGRAFTPIGEGEMTISRLTLSVDGWLHALVRAPTGADVKNVNGELVDLPRHGLVRFRRDGTGFRVSLESDRPLAEFRIDTDLESWVEVDRPSDAAPAPRRLFRLNPLPGAAWADLERLEKPRRTPDGSLVAFGADGAAVPTWLAGEELWAMSPEDGEARRLAEIGGARTHVSDGAVHWILRERKERPRVILLVKEGSDLPSVVLDEERDEALPTLLASPYPSVRKEAAFEILRRRRDPLDRLSRLRAEISPRGRAPLWATLAQLPGDRAFTALTTAEPPDDAGSRRAAWHRLVGDRPEATNHPLFGEITESDSPAVTAGLLAALHHSETRTEGIEELALPWVVHPDSGLATTARSFLIARRASDRCLEALDDPEQEELHPGLFAVLSRMREREVVSGLLERMRHTSSPDFRRLGFEALADLYHAVPATGETWDGSSAIEDHFREALANPRNDRLFLLDLVRSRGIPAVDPDALVALGKERIPFEATAVESLLEGPVPGSARDWLLDLAVAEHRDPDLRMRAVAALLPTPDPELARSLFERLDEIGSDRVALPTWEMTRERWLASPAHEENVDWLLRRARGSNPKQGSLAWQTLLRVADRAEKEAAVVGEITQAVTATREKGGNGLARLLNAVAAAGYGEAGPLVATGAASGDDQVGRAAEAAARALGLDPATGDSLGPIIGAMDPAEVPARVGELEAASGDGWDAFERARCGECHNIHGEGPVFGPDLAAAAARLDAEGLAEAMLRPSAEQASGFETRVFELRSGARLWGHVRHRGETITLRDRAGNLVEFPADEVRLEWDAGESVMPGHGVDHLRLGEFASLLAYVRSLGRAN